MEQCITTILQGNNSLLRPVMLLDVIEKNLVICNNSKYNDQVLYVLSLLMNYCVFYCSIGLSLEAFVFLSISKSSTTSLSSKLQSIFSSRHTLYDLISRY